MILARGCIKTTSSGHLETSLSCAEPRRSYVVEGWTQQTFLAYLGMTLLPFFLRFAPPQQFFASEWILLLGSHLFNVPGLTLDVSVDFILMFIVVSKGRVNLPHREMRMLAVHFFRTPAITHLI